MSNISQHVGISNCPSKQQGVVLFIALIALVVLSLAGISLIRSVDTANTIVGNIGIKQATVQEAELGAKSAFDALFGAAGLIPDKTVNNLAQNYYSTLLPEDSQTGIPTSILNTMPTNNVIDHKNITGSGRTGNIIGYVIERMCNPVPATGTSPVSLTEIQANCVTTPSSDAGTAGNASSSYNSGDGLREDLVYYRITTRVEGPNNTISFTQSFVLGPG